MKRRETTETRLLGVLSARGSIPLNVEDAAELPGVTSRTIVNAVNASGLMDFDGVALGDSMGGRYDVAQREWTIIKVEEDFL